MTSEITNYRDAFSLDGKVALVTGAAGTLGAEICRGLTSVGASVLITDIVEDRGVALRDELRASGANAEFFKHNVCLLYTSPSPRDAHESRMPSSA